MYQSVNYLHSLAGNHCWRNESAHMSLAPFIADCEKGTKVVTTSSLDFRREEFLSFSLNKNAYGRKANTRGLQIFKVTTPRKYHTRQGIHVLRREPFEEGVAGTAEVF